MQKGNVEHSKSTGLGLSIWVWVLSLATRVSQSSSIASLSFSFLLCKHAVFLAYLIGTLKNTNEAKCIQITLWTIKGPFEFRYYIYLYLLLEELCWWVLAWNEAWISLHLCFAEIESVMNSHRASEKPMKVQKMKTLHNKRRTCSH